VRESPRREPVVPVSGTPGTPATSPRSVKVRLIVPPSRTSVPKFIRVSPFVRVPRGAEEASLAKVKLLGPLGRKSLMDMIVLNKLLSGSVQPNPVLFVSKSVELTLTFQKSVKGFVTVTRDVDPS